MRRIAFACAGLAIAVTVAAIDVAASSDAGAPAAAAACPAHASLPTAAIPRAYSTADAVERQNKINQAFDPAAETILLGDSIVHAWPGPEIRQFIPTGKVLNWGVGGSLTQNLLWQLSSEQLQTLHPKRVVVWIGTNNILVGGDTPCHIATAYGVIASRIRALWPDATVYALGILPVQSRYRDADRVSVNGRIKEIAGEKGFTYINLDDAVRCPEEAPCDLYQKDGIHLKQDGYHAIVKYMNSYLNK